MTRRKFTSKFKTNVVLETLKERMSTVELAGKYRRAAVRGMSYRRNRSARGNESF